MPRTRMVHRDGNYTLTFYFQYGRACSVGMLLCDLEVHFNSNSRFSPFHPLPPFLSRSLISRGSLLGLCLRSFFPLSDFRRILSSQTTFGTVKGGREGSGRWKDKSFQIFPIKTFHNLTSIFLAIA